VHELDDIRRWYVGNLASHVEALERVRTTPQGMAESLASVRRLAHSLRGSGATYGFPAISAAAAAVEDAPDAEVAPRIEGLLTTLRAAIAAAPVPTILLIEDDEAVIRLLERVLAESGKTVVAARSASEARELLRSLTPEVIILDLVLPDCDGRNLLLELRAGQATATTPVLVLTCKGGALTRSECRALGATDFVEKPFDALRVASSVETMTHRPVPTELSLERPSRQRTRAALEEALAAGSGPDAWVGVVEVDDLAGVAAREGQPAADEAVRRCAGVLEATLGPSDVFTRQPGGAFVVLLEGDAPPARLDHASTAHVVTGARGEPVRVTCTSGAARAARSAGLPAALETAARAVAARRASAAAPPAARPCVLLADDDDVVAAPLVRALEQQGLDVCHVHDGAAALSLIGVREFALFVVDVRMPFVDGFEVLSRIRALPALAGIPVVMFTAVGSEADVCRAFEIGADEYIVKPFRPAEAVARVRRLLARPAPRPVAGPPPPDIAAGDTMAIDVPAQRAAVGSIHEQFDKYEVLERLGEGATGKVFKARHKLLGTVVALKVLHASLAQDATLRERFLREARAASQLVHANAIAVRDCGVMPDGRLYMIQDFCPGTSLRALLSSEGRLPPARAVALTRQCLGALAAAHAQGIIHRDLKPENILVDTDGTGAPRARICDFGIAKVDGAASAGLTGHFVVGSPAYMSPEQASGQAVDGRSDLYSMGCVLYELLAGSPPFRASSAMGYLKAHLEQAPEPPSKRGVTLPRGLGAIVLKVLAKRPGERPSTAEELSHLLEACLEAAPLEARAADPARASRPPVGLLAFVANMGSNAIAVFDVSRQTGALTPTGDPISTSACPMALATHPGPARLYVVHDSRGPITSYAIRDRRLTQEARADGGGAVAIAVAPDGRFAYTACASANTVAIHAIDGAALVPVGQALAGVNPKALAVHPSGRSLYVATRGSSEVIAFSVDRRTGALARVGAAQVGAGPRAMVLDRAGRFAYVASTGSGTIATLAIDAGTGLARPCADPTPAGTEASALALDEAGRTLLSCDTKGRRLRAFRVSADGLLQAAGSCETGAVPCAVACAGAFVYVANYGSSEVWVFEVDARTGAPGLVAKVHSGGKAPYAIVLADASARSP
jgi:DNA-binding response OmpR family regulator/6-phosphogluconolactonase (cycloisomerase 2 family)